MQHLGRLLDGKAAKESQFYDSPLLRIEDGQTFQRLVERQRHAAGLDFPATPHTLRHTHASDVVRNTGNLRVVQELLGHQSLLTAQVYTHPRREEMARAVETLVRPG